MNGPNDPVQPDWNTNPQKPVAFCQNCGLPLDSASVRKVGPAVYCEPCLAARLAGATAHGAANGSAGFGSAAGFGGATHQPGYGPVYGGGAGSGIPVPPRAPNPGLAALLGLIPGVGAMYNEQYAKGVAHLLIFAILVMFSHISGIFGLFVMGWVCYMAIEAHHTAVARRDGTPLPNPFGLNDVGERMGFGKAWPQGADVASAARDAATAAAAAAADAAANFRRQPASPVAPAATPASAGPAWGAPMDAYKSAYAQTPPYSAPYTSRDTAPGATYTPPQPAPSAPAYGPPVYGVPYTPVAGTNVPPIPSIACAPNRFPAGAVWLIGLGMFFLLSTLGIFHAVPGSALLGVFLMVLGVWTFLRRMTAGGSLAYDGTAAYQLRLLRALRGAIWLIAVGIFALLDSFHLMSWSYSWPWIIILVGVMMLAQRIVYNSAAAAVPPPAPAYVEGWDDPATAPGAAAAGAATAGREGKL